MASSRGRGYVVRELSNAPTTTPRLKLTLRHRAVLEALARDDLVYSPAEGAFLQGTAASVQYAAPLIDDLLALDLASDDGLITLNGTTALEWPLWKFLQTDWDLLQHRQVRRT